jgi:hypothetical protein
VKGTKVLARSIGQKEKMDKEMKESQISKEKKQDLMCEGRKQKYI